MGTELEAREYKLLLDPRQFPKKIGLEEANDFWDKVLDKLKSYRDDVFQFEGRFKEINTRKVRFLDLPNCALTANDLALRIRDGDGAAEITLKFRGADYFVVKDAFLNSDVAGAEKKFEEDIAPLEIKPKDPDANIVFPANHSIRSRYAFSATHEKKTWSNGTKVGQVFDLYPFLRDVAGLAAPDATRDLIGGPKITETVIDGPKARLDGKTSKFTLTHWSFEDEEGKKRLVDELSFKCKIKGKDMSAGRAQQAFDLFVALQTNLNINLVESSKTALVLPSQCVAY